MSSVSRQKDSVAVNKGLMTNSWGEPMEAQSNKVLSVSRKDGTLETLELLRMRATLEWASQGYEADVSLDWIVQETLKNIFDGISPDELEDAMILAATSFIERDPAYSQIAAQLLRKKLFRQITGKALHKEDADVVYRQSFITSIKQGIALGLLDKRMGQFDLHELADALLLDRDLLFEYMGLRTIYERYFMKHEGIRYEMPQTFWMRVAMGLALEEDNPTARAIEFYRLMSSFRYVPSTPTLLHAGMVHSQLSSCYLTTVEDNLEHIFKCLGDNAQLSRWSGGVANDWTNLRSTGAYISSIKNSGQGVVPFLKIANDVTAAINRSGSRRGATVVYLESWHLDYEDFLDLRRNTGDERRRTHDINTAAWVPDLFMKRVLNDSEWTLFSPHETPELHHLYGKAFEQKYEEYERKAQRGELKQHKVVSAKQLWRKHLTRLFETGHPWVTFKDPSNIRSPQDHVGVVHSSNLCTEITLNTSETETAVCNLGSVNLAKHIINGQLDDALLERTVTTAMRMLDNVIDINYYPTKEAKFSNLQHRPVGLGIMGFQDALYKLGFNFDTEQARDFADTLQEKISYHAIHTSSQLAKERGAYASYPGSKWNRNIFPVDTIDLLEQERGMPIEMNRTCRLDWAPVRAHVKQWGMRNSNTMAIAPTATIANIAGCFPCIEPIYKNLYVKANMSGEFTVVNTYLVQDLKNAGLWSQDMLDWLKYYDGNVQMVDVIPQWIKEKYKEAFEIDPLWLVEITAARGKWIDQSQSHNVFMKGVSGQKLHDVYFAGWRKGIKTYYYFRSLGATQIEKSTLDAKKYGFTQKREYGASQGAPVQDQVVPEPVQSDKDFLSTAKACSIENPDCESCQ